jgi:hypothetical protein
MMDNDNTTKKYDTLTTNIKERTEIKAEQSNNTITITQDT